MGGAAVKSRHGRAAAWCCALALMLGRSGDARAQDATPTLNVQRFEPSGSPSGFATVYTARLLPRARFGFDLTVSYAWRSAQTYNEVGNELLIAEEGMEHLTAIHLRAAATPTAWFQIMVRAPLLQFASTGFAFDDLGGNRDEVFGIGDTTIELGFRALPEERGVGLAFFPFVTAPTGSRALLITHGVPTFGGRLALSGTAGIAHLSAYTGYRAMIGASSVLDSAVIDDEVLYGAGVGLQAVPGVFRLNFEANGGTVVGPGRQLVVDRGSFERRHTAIELHGNLRFTTQLGLALMIGAGGGPTPALGNPAARAYFTMGYAPNTPPDTDGDGIPNERDACRADPEDFDGFEDEDGCPEADNDKDGVLDPADECALQPEDFDGFEDEDGCPDRDNDRDRVPDTTDACPDDPEDRDRHRDDDGCPDPDNDSDGLLDPDDACPDVAEDFDGFSDEDGCPEEEADRDADGLIDPLDACPDAAEDFDGYADADGCPDPDNDLDGIADPVDLCPNEPEEFNGFADEDGCPDETKAVLYNDRIVIMDKVHFYVDEARIEESSFGLLDAVVATILANPQVSLIRVEGHTDAQGSDDYNQQLSERRAMSVRDYLVTHGVAPERLVAEGFGELYPIAPNRTPEGRERNRRVEFIVVPPESPPEAPPEAPRAPDEAPGG
jgi:outer membrane protein OmpA-like peptidoglycan-associated protein